MGINNTRNNCIKTSGQKVVSRKNVNINVKLLVSSIHSKSKTYIYDFTLIN